VHDVAALMPVLPQNDDAGHVVAAALAVGQYVVGWQRTCAVEFEPSGHWYPALHSPVGALSPVVEQYEPAVQRAQTERPVLLQKRPIGLGVYMASKGAGQNAPRGQLVEMVLPIGQYVPLTHEN
jgi:hypothetical protein